VTKRALKNIQALASFNREGCKGVSKVMHSKLGHACFSANPLPYMMNVGDVPR
jgi:hypothetical protein